MNQHPTSTSATSTPVPRRAKNSRKHAEQRYPVDQLAYNLLCYLEYHGTHKLAQVSSIELDDRTLPVVRYGRTETDPVLHYCDRSHFEIVYNPSGARPAKSCWESGGAKKKSSKESLMHIKYSKHKTDSSWRRQLFLLKSQPTELLKNKFWVSWIFCDSPNPTTPVALMESGHVPTEPPSQEGGIPSPSSAENSEEGFLFSSGSMQGSAVMPHQPHVPLDSATRSLFSIPPQNATPVPGASLHTSPLLRCVNRFPLPTTQLDWSAGNRESPDKPSGLDETADSTSESAANLVNNLYDNTHHAEVDYSQDSSPVSPPSCSTSYPSDSEESQSMSSLASLPSIEYEIEQFFSNDG